MAKRSKPKGVQLNLFQEEIPPFTDAWNKGIHYRFNIPDEAINKEPFVFGEDVYNPGDLIEKLGNTSRSMLNIGRPFIYDGRIGPMILLKVDDNWPVRYHIVVFQITNDSLHNFIRPGIGYDITLK